jgi:oligopeptide transport system permease protein
MGQPDNFTTACPVGLISAAPQPRIRIRTGLIGLAVIAAIAVPCFVTLPWSLARYDNQRLEGHITQAPPSIAEPMGTDILGRSLMWRCLLGGAISLSIGVCAAVIAVAIGVVWGAVAGYAGGRIDATMMRIVDVLYGLPYILLVVLIDIALQPRIEAAAAVLLPAHASAGLARVATLLIAIGAVSWLTMARVIRGQVLSLRSRPFIEAARACGLGPCRIILRHMLPNLVGPIIVYATLTVPTAILQESFLSFLGIGVRPPLPSWGNLAAEGIGELHALGQAGFKVRWWLLAWPCTLLGLTLLALNLLGDALRGRLDPRLNP